MNAFVTAGLVAVVFLAAVHAGAPRGPALASAATLPWATFVGAEAKDFGAEPLAALCLVAALFAARKARRKTRGGQGQAALAGLLASLAPLTRAEAIVLLPAPAWLAGGRTAGAGRRYAAFAAGAAPGLAVALLYTLWRFGRFASGYGHHGQGLEPTSIPAGLLGLVLSPGRSVLIYAPVLLFVLWFLRREWKALPALARAALAMGAADLLVHAAWPIWSGGFVWGPRYAFLLAVVAHLVAPFGATGPLRRRAFAALAVLGVAVNLPGLLANPPDYLEALHAAYPPWGEDRAWWDPRFHPWLGHVALLVRGRHDLWIVRALGG